MKLLKSYFNQKKINKRKNHTKKKSIVLFTKKSNKKAILLTIKKRLNDSFKLSSVKENRNKRIYKLFLKKKNLSNKFISLSIKKYKYDSHLNQYIDNKDKSLERTDLSIENEKADKAILFFRKKRFKNKSRSARRWKTRKIKNLTKLPEKRRRNKKTKILYTKKTFVGKGNIKHTNDKVVITFFVYNAKAMYLSSKYNIEKKRLFYPNRRFKRWLTKKTLNKKLRNKRSYNIYESLSGRLLILLYKRHLRVLTKKYNKEMKKINRVLNVNNYLILDSKEKLSLLNTINKSINSFYYPSYSNYKKLAYKAFMRKLKIYNKLISFNKQKYKYSFLYKFIPLIENLYRKKVVFNIVNLKKLHNSSDIYTQIISLKLRNRKNQLYRVLKTFLKKISLRSVRKNIKITEYNNRKIKANNIKNNLINSMISKMYNNKFYRFAYYKKLLTINEKKNLMFEQNFEDPLNRLILEYFNTTDVAEWFRSKKIFSKRSFKYINIRKAREALKEAYDVFTINYVLGRLNQNKLRGVRVEAKGRLTRRRTASRSVFKMIYKGGLKNPVSSFKGLSATMLRGDQKSNLEYSNVNSNGRNGAFGVKGWIASRTSKVKIT